MAFIASKSWQRRTHVAVINSQEKGSHDPKYYDIFGKLAFSKKKNLEKGQNEIPLDVPDLRSGTYLLNMSGQNWRNMPLRFVVTRW